jgi:hypothetical protein
LEAYVQVAYIPDYYYRNQWDPDVNEYFKAEFSKFYLYGGIDIEPFSHLTISTDIKARWRTTLLPNTVSLRIKKMEMYSSIALMMHGHLPE